MLPLHELVWPLLGAIVSGGLIGVEREWRGRPAGFRTHILVSMSSCLLMLAALHQTHWAFDAIPKDNIMTDPTRMAHGVLTGIGFLCAGVIFRQGLSVHGLTTAASLWMTAALGLMYGAGLVEMAALGTAVTIVVLVVLKLVIRRLPAWYGAEVEVSWPREDRNAAEAIGAVIKACDSHAIASRLTSQNALCACNWRVKFKNKQALTMLSTQLAQMPQVSGYCIEAHDD